MDDMVLPSNIVSWTETGRVNTGEQQMRKGKIYFDIGVK
jgi:hypothetical protein